MVLDHNVKEITTKSNEFHTIQFLISDNKNFASKICRWICSRRKLRNFWSISLYVQEWRFSRVSTDVYIQMIRKQGEKRKASKRVQATTTTTTTMKMMIWLGPRCTYAAMLFDRGHRSIDAWYFIFSICFFNASLSMVASTLGSMVTAAPPLSQIGKARAPTQENQ